jgi:hypothetical protein
MTGDHGHKLRHSFYVDDLEQVRAYHATEP